MRRSLFHLGVVLSWIILCASSNAQSYGLASRPSFAAFSDGKLPQSAPTFSGNWSAVVAFPNLTFLNPMGLLPIPGTSNLMVWEREGRIYQFSNDPKASAKTLVLDISRQTQGWDDSGLMGIAFHPGFVTNRYLFVYYTYVAPGTVKGNSGTRPPTDTPNHDRLERYTLDENGIAIPESATIFIDQISETVWHNGGGMFFHPKDGFLYLTNGDDARGANDQRINYSLHSAVLRLDVDQRGGTISHPIPKQPLPAGSKTANYYIPNDNPFVGQAGVLEEFFALGLRSPHRMTIDPPTGRIFIGDVGESSYEELDIIEPSSPFGLNFQWNRIEGKHGNLTAPFIGIDHPPVLDYPHSEGAAIIGGYVYRGKEFAADLSGKYIFGDNIANVVWMLDESTTPATKKLLCTVPPGSGPNSGNDYVGLSSFGYDQNGELYMCQLSSIGGKIYKLQRGGTPAPQMPALLSQTGVFKDLQSLTPATGFVNYSVNSPLWSDGAVKTRWFGIPDGKKIGFSTNGEWTFPEGSVWVKHFELPVNETNASIRRRLETRLLVRDTNGYIYGASYKWRPDQSDAEIVNGAVTEDIPITLDKKQQWYFPSRQDCLSCHTRAAGGVLGLKARQSNGDHLFAETGVTDNQLRAWNHAGYFEPALDEAALPNILKLVTVTNLTASLEFRIRSYLDANCSHCHRPGGVPANWDARIETPLGLANIVGGSVIDTLGITGAHNIVPQDVSRSIMHKRISTASESYKMPPLAKNVVDTNAVNALTAWINSLAMTPQVAMTSPSSGILYYSPVTIPLGVNATSTNGSIVRVDYYIGEVKIGESTNAPFTLPWTATQSGTFEIAAFATDSAGLTGKSEPVSITVIGTGTPGLLAEYFDNMNLTTKKVTRVDSTIDFDWGDGSPDSQIGVDTFSARWTGRIRPRFTQNYTFYVTADDGVRLWINGQQLVNKWIDQSPTTYPVTVTLQANQLYDIRMEMYENGGGAVARLEWSSPSQARQVVPSSVLLPPAPPNSAPIVTLTAPGQSTAFYQPAAIQIEAEATDPDSNLAKVEFFADGTKLGEISNPPYIWQWPLPPAGSHMLSATATDAGGLSSSSSPVLIAVNLLSINIQTTVPGRFRIECTASDGTRYRIERSSNLIDWETADTVTASNGKISFSDSTELAAQRFYRIVAVP